MPKSGYAVTVCGLEVSFGMATYLAVAGIGCVLLLVFTGIAVLFERRYQRVDNQAIRRRASWRPPEEREELKDE